MPVSYQWQQRFDRWRNATRGFFGGGGGSGDNQPRPKLCPACNSLVGINATRCHECGANLRFSLAALSKGLTGFFGGQAPATTAILIANVIMFAATLLIGFAKGQGQGFGILFSVNGEALYRLGMAIPFRYAAASFPGSLRFSPSDYFSAVCVPTTGATLAASPLAFCLAATSPTANR